MKFLEQRSPHLNVIELRTPEIPIKTIHPNRGKKRLYGHAQF